MTREQTIKKALELLDPPRGERGNCRTLIETMLSAVQVAIEDAKAEKATCSKQGKASLKRYVAALRRVRVAHSALDPSWRHRSGFIVPGAISNDIEEAERLLRRSPRPRARSPNMRSRAAVAVSYFLLRRYGHETLVTRNGHWYRLAKLLAGSETDVLDQMAGFKRNKFKIWALPDGI